MLNRILPAQFDNVFRGLKPAIWLLVPIVLLKLFMSLNVMGVDPWVSNRMVLTVADNIPLDTFSPGAANTVVWFFSAWGLAQLMLVTLCILALFRYRSMIPLLYLLMLVDHLGRKLLLAFNPIPRTSTLFAFDINLIFIIALILGLIISIVPGNVRTTQESTA